MAQKRKRRKTQQFRRVPPPVAATPRPAPSPALEPLSPAWANAVDPLPQDEAGLLAVAEHAPTRLDVSVRAHLSEAVALKVPLEVSWMLSVFPPEALTEAVALRVAARVEAPWYRFPRTALTAAVLARSHYDAFVEFPPETKSEAALFSILREHPLTLRWHRVPPESLSERVLRAALAHNPEAVLEFPEAALSEAVLCAALETLSPSAYPRVLPEVPPAAFGAQVAGVVQRRAPDAVALMPEPWGVKQQTYSGRHGEEPVTEEAALWYARHAPEVLHRFPERLVTERVALGVLEHHPARLDKVPRHVRTPRVVMAALADPALVWERGAVSGYVPESALLPEVIVSIGEVITEGWWQVPAHPFTPERALRWLEHLWSLSEMPNHSETWWLAARTLPGHAFDAAVLEHIHTSNPWDEHAPWAHLPFEARLLFAEGRALG